MVRHFREHGWVVVDALPLRARSQLAAWVDEIAALPESAGVLQHREATDSGPQLCRSEQFLEVHAGLRELLCTGPLVDVASTLLGEPAVLYKEKINYKLAGGAGYTAHQDAPAYPMIESHVSAMIAVDDADADNGGLEVVSGCFASVLPTDPRGCIDRADRRHARVGTGEPRSRSHTVVPQPYAPPQPRQPLRSAPPRAVPDLQRRARG